MHRCSPSSATPATSASSSCTTSAPSPPTADRSPSPRPVSTSFTPTPESPSPPADRAYGASRFRRTAAQYGESVNFDAILRTKPNSPPIAKGGNMYRGKLLLVFALALFLVILGTGPAAAQSTARLEGIVSDSTGASLPGVTITATNTGTNAARSDVSNSKGEYTITPLPIGPYRIRFELSGFKTSEV